MMIVFFTNIDRSEYHVLCDYWNTQDITPTEIKSREVGLYLS